MNELRDLDINTCENDLRYDIELDEVFEDPEYSDFGSGTFAPSRGVTNDRTGSPVTGSDYIGIGGARNEASGLFSGSL